MRHAPQPRCAYLLACLLLATMALAGDPATGRERQSGPKPYPATVDQWPGVGVVRVFDWMPSRRSAFWRERETVGPGSVVFVGDSLTEGWRSLAADFPGLNIANRGIGGDVSRGVLFRFEEDVLALRPRIVVLLIGINDLTARQPAVQTLSNIRAMLELSRRRAPEPIVILCTVPPSDNSQAPVDEMQRRLVNDGLRKIAGEESSVLLVDLFAALSDPGGKPRPELFVADRLHFSAAGYSEWKKALMPALQKAGSL